MLHVAVGHSKFESGRSEKLLGVSYQLLAFSLEPRGLSFERSTGALPRDYALNASPTAPERFTSLELTP